MADESEKSNVESESDTNNKTKRGRPKKLIKTNGNNKKDRSNKFPLNNADKIDKTSKLKRK